MITFLGTAIVSMTLALFFYSVGTWAERFQGTLKLWHIVFFVLGLFADSVGTAVMTRIAGDEMDFLHGITGALALFLMMIHASWAIWTLWKGSLRARRNFSKFSVLVWAFWLIPYGLGIVQGISR